MQLTGVRSTLLGFDTELLSDFVDFNSLTTEREYVLDFTFKLIWILVLVEV